MDFLEYLTEKKALDGGQAEKIKTEVKKTGRTAEELILNAKLIKESELFRQKSAFLDVPLKEELKEEIQPETFSIIPKESVEFYKMAPLSWDKSRSVLLIGMVYPEDVQAKEALKFLARQERFVPEIVLITISQFDRYLDKYHAPEKEMEKALRTLEEEISKEPKEKSKPATAEFGRIVEEAPIIKMVAVIIRQGVEGGASDIHIEPLAENLRIRYRMDGILYSSLFLPLRIHPAVVARIKILSGLKIDEMRVPQDGRFSTMIGSKKIDFRVATFPTKLGEKVALRVLDPGEGARSLADLGFRGRNLEIIEEAIRKPYGMILATGPTGSGKSTTLYSLLGILNKEGVNIVTLEDPIEYYIEGVNQSQVRPDINYTFASGLRQILRQDPNIIMVGEIRDEETAALAVHAGLTGHLVLSTLHTTSAVGVIPRLIDMGVEPFLIPPTLSIVISQRLLRKLCAACKEKTKLEGRERIYIAEKIKSLPQNSGVKRKVEATVYVYKPKGCAKCNFKGYSGRIGIYEVMDMTKELSLIVGKRPSDVEIFREARKQGMLTMEEDGILKVLDGSTSLEEVMRVTEEV